MKLSCINETVSRRAFLKGLSAAAAAAAMPGITPSVAPAAAAPAAAPAASPMAFTIGTGTHYGRGGPPMLSDQFAAVNSAASTAKQLSGGNPIGGASDEDFMFHGNLSPEAAESVKAGVESEEEFEIPGIPGIWRAFEEGPGEIYIENQDGQVLNAYANGLPDWLGHEAEFTEENPIKTWWDQYGRFGDEPIDAEAAEVVRELDLDLHDRYDWEEIELERRREEGEGEEEPEDEEDKLGEAPDADKAWPMHQPFESQLKTILAVLD